MPTRLRVLTLNLRNVADRWPARLPLLLAEFGALQPDVAGLQEVVFVMQQDRLLGASGPSHYAIRRAWSYRPNEAGNSLLVRETLARIRPGDIGHDEALAIAKHYLARFGRQQATVARLTDQGGHWEADVLNRYQGFSTLPLIIDKSTGGVRWAQGPTTRSIEELLAN